MIASIRNWLLARQIERACKRHASIRKARAEAAKRGQHTEWKRRAARTRELFG